MKREYAEALEEAFRIAKKARDWQPDILYRITFTACEDGVQIRSVEEV